MKGQAVITINQATMLEAMQQYFDKQLATTHRVTEVKKDSNTYAAADSFIVSFSEPDAAKEG